MPIGVAAYLLGLALFHRVLAPGWQLGRVLAAVVTVVVVPFAGMIGGWAMLALTVVVLGLTVAVPASRGRLPANPHR